MLYCPHHSHPEITKSPMLAPVSANYHRAKMQSGVFMLVVSRCLSKQLLGFPFFCQQWTHNYCSITGLNHAHRSIKSITLNMIQIILQTLSVLHHLLLANPRGPQEFVFLPPPYLISFTFMQFSGKMLPNNRFLATSQGLAPPVREILDPPLPAVNRFLRFKSGAIPTDLLTASKLHPLSFSASDPNAFLQCELALMLLSSVNWP